MDKTVTEHVIIATVIYVIMMLVFGNNWTGAFVASTVFITRELTQAEYRWIDMFGEGKRSNLPWYGAIDPRVWDAGDLFDWIMPTVVVFALAFLVYLIKLYSDLPVDLPEFWYRWLA